MPMMFFMVPRNFALPGPINITRGLYPTDDVPTQRMLAKVPDVREATPEEVATALALKSAERGGGAIGRALAKADPDWRHKAQQVAREARQRDEVRKAATEHQRRIQLAADRGEPPPAAPQAPALGDTPIALTSTPPGVTIPPLRESVAAIAGAVAPGTEVVFSPAGQDAGPVEDDSTTDGDETPPTVRMVPPAGGEPEEDEEPTAEPQATAGDDVEPAPGFPYLTKTQLMEWLAKHGIHGANRNQSRKSLEEWCVRAAADIRAARKGETK